MLSNQEIINKLSDIANCPFFNVEFKEKQALTASQGHFVIGYCIDSDFKLEEDKLNKSKILNKYLLSSETDQYDKHIVLRKDFILWLYENNLEENCNICNGLKKVNCCKCDGKNKIECSECNGYCTVNNLCEDCGDSDDCKCQECNGEGFIECDLCDKDNKIKCPECFEEEYISIYGYVINSFFLKMCIDLLDQQDLIFCTPKDTADPMIIKTGKSFFIVMKINDLYAKPVRCWVGYI